MPSEKAMKLDYIKSSIFYQEQLHNFKYIRSRSWVVR